MKRIFHMTPTETSTLVGEGQVDSLSHVRIVATGSSPDHADSARSAPTVTTEAVPSEGIPRSAMGPPQPWNRLSGARPICCEPSPLTPLPGHGQDTSP